MSAAVRDYSVAIYRGEGIGDIDAKPYLSVAHLYLFVCQLRHPAVRLFLADMGDNGARAGADFGAL